MTLRAPHSRETCLRPTSVYDGVMTLRAPPQGCAGSAPGPSPAPTGLCPWPLTPARPRSSGRRRLPSACSVITLVHPRSDEQGRAPPSQRRNLQAPRAERERVTGRTSARTRRSARAHAAPQANDHPAQAAAQRPTPAAASEPGRPRAPRRPRARTSGSGAPWDLESAGGGGGRTAQHEGSRLRGLGARDVTRRRQHCAARGSRGLLGSGLPPPLAPAPSFPSLTPPRSHA